MRINGPFGGLAAARRGAFESHEPNERLSPGFLGRLIGDEAFAAEFGGADFAHGGVASAVAGAPHVPAGDGAVGAPAFAESEEFFRFGLVFFAVGDGPAFLYAEVVDGENVGAAEPENQKHFDRPGADAADGGEAFDEFFVGEFLRVLESGDDAFDGFFREVFHGGDFGTGEAGFAKGLLAEFEHFLRAGRAARGAEGFDAAENGGGCFAGDGLVGDGFEKGFVGAFGEDLVELEWLRGLD